MKRTFKRISVFLIIGILSISLFYVEGQTATLVVDSNVKHQKITGFGGFVNSPQFGYNHMTTSQIRQLWGKDSETKYNIMRLYIPVGEHNWEQAIATAKLAQSLGILIFASPWSPPGQWKTNNSANGVVIRDGVEDIGYLKEEHYEDYAHYLNNFVTLMRDNGVELIGISVQNEADYKVSYAGCMWTPEQIATFVRDYGHIIDCPIIAPETVGITDRYVYPFIEDEDAFNNLGIYAGHQYGAIQSAHKQLQAKGMEVWQTEYLINWNANKPSDRDFNWSIDAFDFASAINNALLNDINAWVHYASKRYYGMMGDGLNGTQNGAITKRGYILSHYAQYTTGTTRIQGSWKGGASVLEGSAFLSLTGDSVIIKVINPSDEPFNLTIDLPFFTDWGKSIVTTESNDMVETEINIADNTFRPKLNIEASSFTTLIFKKSSDRPESQMIGEAVYYNRIENTTVTNPAFGETYKLSGATVVFDVNRPLISKFTNSNSGYLALDDRYSKLVLHIESISSAMTYTSANTTLYYVNDNGVVKSHNYGTFNLSQQGNFNWEIDISPSVLTDGCTGIIGISNGNYTSVLTITFGDVYFLLGNEKAFDFSGVYSSGDSDLLDALEDPNTTSIDFTATTGMPTDLDLQKIAQNPNSVFYVDIDVSNDNPNFIAGSINNELILSDEGGDFFAPYSFNSNKASYTRNVDRYGIMVLPFESDIPEDLIAYTLYYSEDQIIGTSIDDNRIPANTPVLIVGTGTFTFSGSGEVTIPKALTVNDLNCSYVKTKAREGSYVLQTVGGITSFNRVLGDSEQNILPFSAYFNIGNRTSALSLPLILDGVLSNINNLLMPENIDENSVIYDLMGRPVSRPVKGVVYIINGKKVVF